MGGRLINSAREQGEEVMGEVLKAVDDAAFPRTDAWYAKLAAEAKKKHKPALKARL
jgi:cytochrome c553